MKNQKRNFRMFKKRIEVMDIYQEYRRSHERVKVMLSEEGEDESDQSVLNPSAQENLQRFIREHETHPLKDEQETGEPRFVNLAEDTILGSENDSREIRHESELIYSSDDSYSQQQNLDTNYSNFQHPDDRTVNYSNEPGSNPKNIEEELETIIREAFNNYQPSLNIKSSDVDPELLNLMKDFLIKKPDFISGTTQPFYDFNTEQIDSNLRTRFLPEYTQDISYNSDALQDESSISNQNIGTPPDADVLEKQITNQQNPPKIPEPLTDLPTNVNDQTSGIFDPSDSHFEDDSSLAITKKELSLQVKNLIKETLENNQKEVSKPNDLIELEKQLKEHIEKIKQSRHEK